jgi:hypothetical protein
MRRVLDFVGEPWDDAVLDHAVHTPLDLPPFPWFRGQGRTREAPASSWREGLSPAWVRWVEWRLRGAMRCYHYEPADLPAEPRFVEKVKAVLGDLPAFVRGLWKLAALHRGLRRRRPIDGQEFLRRALELNPGARRHYPGFFLRDRAALE